MIDRGEVLAAIVVPKGFSRDLLRATPPTVQVLIDGTNGTIASALAGYTQAVVLDAVGERASEVRIAAGSSRRSGSGAAAGTISLMPRVWFNPASSRAIATSSPGLWRLSW